MSSSRSFLSLFLFVFVSCATTTADRPRETEFLGPASDQQKFVGTWRGSITFPADHAALDTTTELSIVPGTDRDAGRVVTGSRNPFLYVRADGSRLIAAAAPAFDRLCMCTVYATAEGELHGEVITGEVRLLEDQRDVVIGTFSLSRLHQ